VALALFVAGAPALFASGAEADGSNLIKPNLGTLFWTALTFLIFAFLLGKFAWGPLTGALDARESSIRDSIESAKTDRQEAERVLAEHKQLVAGAHRERATALAAGQEEGERLKAEILEEARKQREQVLAQADAQVQSGLRQAQAELRAVAVDLAIQAAGKLLDKNLDDTAQRQLVERHLAELERSGGSSAAPS
jgi:F-type H+-transporting ATPase subunit b